MGLKLKSVEQIDLLGDGLTTHVALCESVGAGDAGGVAAHEGHGARVLATNHTVDGLLHVLHSLLHPLHLFRRGLSGPRSRGRI